jgi:hypothetical protein
MLMLLAPCRSPPSPRKVKAWCYYESRLLGAHHGLISTYALETLVLYVFNRHHASQPITTPLQVRGARPAADTNSAWRSLGTWDPGPAVAPFSGRAAAGRSERNRRVSARILLTPLQAINACL